MRMANGECLACDRRHSNQRQCLSNRSGAEPRRNEIAITATPSNAVGSSAMLGCAASHSKLTRTPSSLQSFARNAWAPTILATINTSAAATKRNVFVISETVKRHYRWRNHTVGSSRDNPGGRDRGGRGVWRGRPPPPSVATIRLGDGIPANHQETEYLSITHSHVPSFWCCATSEVTVPLRLRVEVRARSPEMSAGRCSRIRTFAFPVQTP